MAYIDKGGEIASARNFLVCKDSHILSVYHLDCAGQVVETWGGEQRAGGMNGLIMHPSSGSVLRFEFAIYVGQGKGGNVLNYLSSKS